MSEKLSKIDPTPLEKKETEPKVYSYYHNNKQADSISERGGSPTCVNGIPYTERMEGDQKPNSINSILVYKTEKGVKDEICYANELNPEQKERLRKMYDLSNLPPGEEYVPGY